MDDNDQPEVNGFMQSFFEYTCYKNNTWTDTINNKVYSRPDQVIAVTDRSKGKLSTKAIVFTSLKNTKSSLEIQAGVGANDESSGFSFSASTAYTNVRDNLIINSNIVTIVS